MSASVQKSVPTVERVGARPLLRPGLAIAGAALSGVLYWASFAGVDAWPFAFFALGPLWVALHGQTPKRAFWLGTLAGATMNVLGFYWLLNMLRTFSGFPTVACMFFLLVVCTYQGTRVGAMGWLYARGVARGWPAIPVVLGAFIASEVGYPLLFPWYFAATTHKVPVLMQIADLGGPVLVGLMLLGVSLAVFEPVVARLEKRAVRVPVVAGGAAGLVLTLVYGAVRIPSVDAAAAAAPPVKVGLVQGNMGLLAKRENPREGLNRHIAKTAELKQQGADFVVWSESSVTFPVPEEAAASVLRARVGEHLHLPAIFGGVLYHSDTERQRYYNVALSTDTAGTITGRYDKEYLLQFGEHLPLSEYFPILNEWSPNSGRFTPGTKLDPLTVTLEGTNHKAAVLICYEDIIPGFTNDLVNATDPEMLVNITNDAWFGATTEPWEHLALAQLRAVEHRRYLVRSTNSGVSAEVDPVGRVLAHTEVRDVQEASFAKPDSLLVDAHWMRGAKTVYELLGNWPWWLCALASIFAAFARRNRAMPAPA
ncbi:MAG TPA: apolipoprotein N-acyltransferase [Polyangiaceae bacterium]